MQAEVMKFVWGLRIRDLMALSIKGTHTIRPRLENTSNRRYFFTHPPPPITSTLIKYFLTIHITVTENEIITSRGWPPTPWRPLLVKDAMPHPHNVHWTFSVAVFELWLFPYLDRRPLGKLSFYLLPNHFHRRLGQGCRTISVLCLFHIG